MKSKFLFYTISVAIASYNSENTIAKCLQSIRNQKYPQNKIEIIIADGGSTDKTLSIVKKYRVKIVHVPQDKQNAEYNKGLAISKARNDLLLFVDHDNVLPHKEWISKMVLPFMTNKNIVGVETLRYHYDRKGSLLDRYFALFGAGDPLAFYLGKADRLSYLYNSYNLFGKAIDKKEYIQVKFSPSKIPTLGANGFMVRRKLLLKEAQADVDHFFHIDVNVDLIRKGFNTYAFIKDDIIHLTGYKNIVNFLKRRKLFMEQFYIQTRNVRRYSVYEKSDKKNLILFIVYSITIVKPLSDSLKGYLKIPDNAWFLHPFLCYALLLIYSYVAIKELIRSHGKLF